MNDVCGHLVKKFTVTIFILFFSVSLLGQSDQVCQTYKYNKSTSSERTFLLGRLKVNLISKAEQSVVSLKRAQSFLTDCQSNACLEFRNNFIEILREQLYVAKMMRAISEKTIILSGRTQSPRTISEVLKRMERKQILPEQIANFNIKGFKFTEAEKKETLKLWFHVFVRVANDLPKGSNLRTAFSQTTNYFKVSSRSVIEINPLLAFLSQESVNDPSQVLKAFDQLIQFNNEFIDMLGGLQTNHKQTFWSYINLTLPDHEMGLVNFRQQTLNVIQDYVTIWKSTSERDLGILCSAWDDLVRQQKIRIRSSIGVGFSTAVVCGVGIWSGVATVPAAALCSFSVADGLWGARRGYLDAKLAHTSFFVGRDFYDDGSFSQGILTLARSQELEKQGDVIMIINLLGLIPVVKAVATAGRTGRGTALSLFTLPANDLLVSGVEAKSAALVYIMMAVRGLEVAESEFQLSLKELEWKTQGQ